MYRDQKPPERPFLPETLLALFCAIYASRFALWCLPWDSVSPAAEAAVLSALAASALICWRGRKLLPAACLACTLVALVSSAAFCARTAGAASALQATSASKLVFVITGDASKGVSGWRCRAKAEGEDGKAVGDVWLVSTRELRSGERVRCIGRMKALEDDDYGRSSFAQGIACSVKAVRIVDVEEPGGLRGGIEKVRSLGEAAFLQDETPERALEVGSVLGFKAPLQEQGLTDMFAACGVSHLVAVSGGHLAVIASALTIILGWLRLSPKTRIAVSVIATGIFVLLCGAPVSAVRAWLMSCAAAGAVLAGRRSHALSSVSFVGLVLIWVSPAAAADIGFLLSVYAVLGLCLFAPYLVYALGLLVPELPWLPRVPRPLLRTISGLRQKALALLAATLAAQLVTAALSAEVFGTFSLVAPLANLVLSVPFSCMIALALLAFALLPVPWISTTLMRLSDAFAAFSLAAVRFLAHLPHASISLSAGTAVPEALVLAVLILWLVVWPDLSARWLRTSALAFAAALVCLVFSWRFLAPARLCVLDVGQGDAILIQEGGAAVLVDTGPEGAIAEALEREHVLHIDAVVLTHLHDDHTGGVKDLAGVAPVGKVYVAEGVNEAMSATLKEEISDLTGSDAEELSEGAAICAGGFTMRMAWPKASVSGEENADSIELVLEHEEGNETFRALLTGDGEEDELRQFVDEVGDIDVLKVGHHGSEISIDADEAKKLSPELAVASAGENNKYGHPTQQCIDTLAGAGARFLCTKDVGTVEIRPRDGGYAVYTER
ncbi:MAG: DNA internalization-related competence protein ComEC/Rec2 [Atopobiaceae bacterium]